MSAVKSKVHDLIIRVRFDKACTAQRAVHEAGQSIHGEFYCDWTVAKLDPRSFVVKSIKRVKVQR